MRSLTTVLVFDLALHGCLSWPVCQDTITAGGQHACSISEGTFKLETPGSASVEDLEVEAPVGSSRPLAPAGLDPGFGLWLGATEGSLSSQEAGSCLRAWESSTMFGGSPTQQAQQPAQTWPGWGSTPPDAEVKKEPAGPSQPSKRDAPKLQDEDSSSDDDGLTPAQRLMKSREPAPKKRNKGNTGQQPSASGPGSGKAGGATVHEAIAACCPMLIHHLVPGQEEGNLNLLEIIGGGHLAASPEGLARNVSDLLADHASGWRAMKNALARHGRNAGAISAARFILNEIGDRGSDTD